MPGNGSQPPPHRVVIAGGGVAGLEALIALRSLGGDRVASTLIAPADDFVVRALSVHAPFDRPPPKRYPLATVCEHHGARFLRQAAHAVDAGRCVVVTDRGEEVPYDSLLVTIGATAIPVLADATTFRGLQDADAMRGLLHDVETGAASRIAFVVPPGVTWPLPLYELALMTAERADMLGLQVVLTIVTPESQPLAIFGTHASETVDRLLRYADVAVITNAHVRGVHDGSVVAGPDGVELPVDRVVALPRLAGPRIPGLPADHDGFVPVDDVCEVRDVPGVFAAGDATTFPLKQGGIAAQQADTASRAIARRAGAEVSVPAFRPRLRAKLLAGARTVYLHENVAGGGGYEASEAADHALWWPPSKVVAPYLAPYLERLDSGHAALTTHTTHGGVS